MAQIREGGPIRRLLDLIDGPARAKACGLQGSAGAYIVARLVERVKGTWAVIVRDLQRAESMARDLAFYCPSGTEVVTFPSWEVLPFEQASPYLHLQGRRMALLRRFLRDHRDFITVIPIAAWMTRLPPRTWVETSFLVLRRGQGISPAEVTAFLDASGYRRVPLVEEGGDYAVRGGILDFFPHPGDLPYRVEFLGDSVESIRTFSPDSQRSTGKVGRVEILPVREIPWSPRDREEALRRLAVRIPLVRGRDFTPTLEALSEGLPLPGVEWLLPLFHDSLGTLMDYLPDECVLVLDDPDSLWEAWKGIWEKAQERSRTKDLPLADLISPEELYLPPPETKGAMGHDRTLELWGPRSPEVAQDLTGTVSFSTSSLEGFRAELLRGAAMEDTLSVVAKRFQRWLDEGLAVYWALKSRGQAERILELLAASGLPCALLDQGRQATGWQPRVWVQVGDPSQGFLCRDLGLVSLTEEEVFGPRMLQRPRRSYRPLPSITHLEDLQEGDLVVHVDHGIGIYRGLVNLGVGGIKGDFLFLEYMGGDRLYVPVDRLRSVHRYVGSEALLPRVDRLGGGAWERRKGRVRRAVHRMARDLLQLYAAREVAKGHAFSVPDELYREFEEAFPYEETPDQRRAVADVMADMALPRPMDRLVCGDVGFGKTEVAMRAAFVAVMEGKQVAYLVPTTILAEQHQRTFKERFRGYPVFIEVLSRFRPPKEQREVLKRCREGTVDILIGTHRLLQKDVVFKSLGLLILDEEHRFGVAHKEHIKRLRKEVDVLTLTATPIPRTLHMAMLGMRDLSIIETPPPERLSIRTVVARFERELVCEAIERELSRGGQVFFVHNRVHGIEEVGQKLQEWLPGLRIGIAHGQMPERQLARVMERFRNGEIGLLLCTTIIEAGLDIPTANTILIDNAHNLGLAEMYQIRGRVGRSGHQAYAYLLVPGQGELNQDARKRLQTLQEFCELGAGFRIATRDLEIRGAGTLLGPSQSGHIEAVGFELYTQLMRRAIAELKGEPLSPEIEPEIHLPVHAYIPEDCLPDAHQRLALYRRLSQMESDEEVRSFREEILDRFGSIPEEWENLLHLVGLRIFLRALGIRHLALVDGRLRIRFHPSTPVSPQCLIEVVQAKPEAGIRFLAEDTLEIPIDGQGLDPLVVLARKKLKALFHDVTISR